MYREAYVRQGGEPYRLPNIFFNLNINPLINDVPQWSDTL